MMILTVKKERNITTKTTMENNNITISQYTTGHPDDGVSITISLKDFQFIDKQIQWALVNNIKQ